MLWLGFLREPFCKSVFSKKSLERKRRDFSQRKCVRGFERKAHVLCFFSLIQWKSSSSSSVKECIYFSLYSSNFLFDYNLRTDSDPMFCPNSTCICASSKNMIIMKLGCISNNYVLILSDSATWFSFLLKMMRVLSATNSRVFMISYIYQKFMMHESSNM